MLKTMLTYVENRGRHRRRRRPVHYLGGLDWPWAIVVGAAASMLLRLLIHSEPLRAWRHARRRQVDKPAS